MADRLRWGILSTGRIAGVFARGLKESRTGVLAACGSRSAAGAEKFGTAHAIPAAHRHASYEALLADPGVDAVYIATPHPAHAEWTIKAARAGKHILCEKPAAMNHPEAMAAIHAARIAKVFYMEAFMYRCHPQTAKLVEMIRGGTIGEVRMLQATFSFQSGNDPAGRLLNPALGGGGILDVGCYPVSLARLVAGAAAGREVLEPAEVTAAGQLGPTGVDEWTAATLKFPNGVVAQVATGVGVNQENVARIYGTKGWLFLAAPWGLKGEGEWTILVHRPDGTTEPVSALADRGSYAFEADVVGDAVAAGRTQAPAPAMTWDDTLGNLKALDRWRAAIGLTYPCERPEGLLEPVHGGPLARRPEAHVPTATLPGLDKRISRIVLGTMPSVVHGFVMFDEFFEQGGNAFDTAYIYGGGKLEKDLGWWVKNRKVRQDVVILSKGAHTPHCHPKALSAQLLESLDRLQTDYADLYVMHRDNPDVPVGEFVDVLNEHAAAGRIRLFGGSNWTRERFEEANAYAKRKNLRPFTLLSNNFSLARMVEAPWGGCLSSATKEWRTWLEQTGTPNLGWSSQARGFFARGRKDDRSEEEMVRCWYADDNFQRLQRAEELGRKKGASATQIALAWALAQPFPSWALVGPQTLEELDSCVAATRLSLTPDEVRWLNLEG